MYERVSSDEPEAGMARALEPHAAGARVLLIDLNNFSRYPTIAIGYLAAALRGAGMHIDVLSPLAHGVNGVVREPPETRLLHAGRKLNYRLTHANGFLARLVRAAIDSTRERSAKRDQQRIGELAQSIDLAGYDAVMISAYLMYRPACELIGRACERAGVPMIVGGSYFANAEVAGAWLDLPGLTALVGGEVELEIPQIVNAVCQRRSISTWPGLWQPGGKGSVRAPLTDLDAVAFPDYRDFPWHRYPNRIIPMITGRGCGWGVCTFCSDVTSTAGRTFRSRSPGNVLDELAFQSQRFDTASFVFTDLKLNSDLRVWEALLRDFPQRVADPCWIGSVHVDADAPNGLGAVELKQARRAGAVRLTTGLESGSQRVLDAWAKGTDLASTSAFLKAARDADISVRVTMIHGAPSERAADVVASAKYLEAHADCIDRVNLNRFQVMIGPRFLERYDQRASRYPTIDITARDPATASAEHVHRLASDRSFRRATARLLNAVHAINRKRLGNVARDFEGVM